MIKTIAQGTPRGAEVVPAGIEEGTSTRFGAEKRSVVPDIAILLMRRQERMRVSAGGNPWDGCRPWAGSEPSLRELNVRSARPCLIRMPRRAS
jgi:hypothetical protein